MTAFLGIDTSNYTTSAAVYQDGQIRQVKRLLPVAAGARGLRQSDAVFHHVRQLPELLEELLAQSDCPLTAIGVSERPQQVEGSYMPCFLAGLGTARALAAAQKRPLYRFAHQQGHIAAAAYGAGCLDWLKAPFLAFHVSGGTTDALLVTPDEHEVIRCEVVAKSLDLKAGQLIDRVGVMMELAFPAGMEMERLARQATGNYVVKAVLREGGCCLSGAENQCREMYESGAPKAEVALFCLKQVEAAVCGMTEALLREKGTLPLLYAGGVMADGLLQQSLHAMFGGRFAPAALSADNAAGVAVLAAVKQGEIR